MAGRGLGGQVSWRLKVVQRLPAFLEAFLSALVDASNWA